MISNIPYILILSTLSTLALAEYDCGNNVTQRYGCGEQVLTPPPDIATYDRPLYDGAYSAELGYGFMGEDHSVMGGGTTEVYPYPYLKYSEEALQYYAADIHVKGQDTHEALFSASINARIFYNYVWFYNVTTNNHYPIIDFALFEGPILDKYARVAYGLQFTNLVEYNDNNGNGLLDEDEPVQAVTSLQDLSWSTFSIVKLPVPGRPDFNYYETGITSKVKYKNDAALGDIDLRITFRATNVQTYDVAPIALQPDSLQYDFSIVNYPKSASANARLGVELILTGNLEDLKEDLNQNTTASEAEIIKQRPIYGLTIGREPTENRLDYQSNVHLTELQPNSSSWKDIHPTDAYKKPYYGDNDKLWGRERFWNYTDNYYQLVTVPISNTDTSGFSGLAYIGPPRAFYGPNGSSAPKTLMRFNFSLAALFVLICLFN